jgi:glycosyltransferase involved in cell wall biosynthesis
MMIPTFDSVSLLSESMESALAQTRSGGEIVVIGNGSTDGTRELASSNGQRTYPHEGASTILDPEP